MPELVLFEEDRAYVIEQFHNGHFDFIEVIQEVVQRDFFRWVAGKALLERLAQSYPWPRKKQEVPAWFYLSADMAMRLHGNHAFHGFPWVVSTGGLLSAFGPDLGVRRVDPEGRMHVECPGFNDKNDYVRCTPCDPDFLRKIARDTPPRRNCWDGTTTPCRAYFAGIAFSTRRACSSRTVPISSCPTTRATRAARACFSMRTNAPCLRSNWPG